MLLHQLYSQTRKPCCRKESARCSVCFSQRLRLLLLYIHCIKADFRSMPTYVTTLPQRHRRTTFRGK